MTLEKCIVCKKGIKEQNNEWCCETCGGTHHPRCSGAYEDGYGEYPSESEYSVCKNCTNKK